MERARASGSRPAAPFGYVCQVRWPRAAYRARGLALGLAVALGCAAEGTAAAQAPDPAALVGGDSRCPTPAAVWQNLGPLVPADLLVDRLRVAGGPSPPVQILDLGTSFLVIAGHRVREYPEPSRDCGERARFAAVFIAVATGADPASVAAAAVPSPRADAVSAVAQPVGGPSEARLRLDLGATAAAMVGGGDPSLAPGLAVRIGFGAGRLVPVAALAVIGPADGTAGGVEIRQWQGTAELDLRSAVRPIGAVRAYVELGAVLEVISDRPTNLAAARSQLSYAVGPRAAVGVLLGTHRRLSPFLLVHGAWFPRTPERFALPAGDLGRAAPWTLGATGGVSWGLR
jgi:hypothetical protein